MRPFLKKWINQSKQMAKHLFDTLKEANTIVDNELKNIQGNLIMMFDKKFYLLAFCFVFTVNHGFDCEDHSLIFSSLRFYS